MQILCCAALHPRHHRAATPATTTRTTSSPPPPAALPIEQHPLHTTASSTTRSSGIPLPQALASHLTPSQRASPTWGNRLCATQEQARSSATGWCRSVLRHRTWTVCHRSWTGEQDGAPAAPGARRPPADAIPSTASAAPRRLPVTATAPTRPPTHHQGQGQQKRKSDHSPHRNQGLTWGNRRGRPKRVQPP